MIESHTPFSMILEINTETSSLRTLKIKPRKKPENLKKLYVHEFGFKFCADQNTPNVCSMLKKNTSRT